MAIDTPARLAILGAGPIGLEAALYARFLGYDVDVYERGEPCAHVRRWGHSRMYTPFGRNRSPLGLAAIVAQDPAYRPPDDAARLTGNEWWSGYLEPLSKTDLLEDHLRMGVEVVAIGRPRRLKGDDAGTEDRRDDLFRLVVRDAAGVESAVFAHAVLDATGVYGRPNRLGAGGLPALGEESCHDRIDYWLPDVAGRDRERFAGRRTLVVGDGDSAIETVVALAELARVAPGTSVAWCVRGTAREALGDASDATTEGRGEEAGREPARAVLRAAARALVDAAEGPVLLYESTLVDSLTHDAASDRLFVRWLDADQPEPFDRVVALVGYRPDDRLADELQTSARPTDDVLLAPDASPRANGFAGSDERGAPAASLEPDYYVLGAKSRGRRSDFRFEDGLRQIRELFAILGDRPTLDLYAGAPRL